MLVSMGFKITIQTNLTTADFFDITLDLGSGAYMPLLQTKQEANVHQHSLLPPNLCVKKLVKGVSKRIMDASSSQEVFNAVTPYYNKALTASGFRDHITYGRKHHRNIN